MISVSRNKYGICFEDVIFCNAPEYYTLRYALAHFSQAKKPLPGFEARTTPIINLKGDLGVTFCKLSSNTRYKIRRAEREGVTGVFTPSPSDGDLMRFTEHFNKFATQKKLPAANRDKLSKLSLGKNLTIIEAQDKDGNVIVSHAYIADQDSSRARLLYSASHYREVSDTEDRNYIGRANRFLHWFEIQEFARHGYEFYDLGGIPVSTENHQKNEIARFKAEFGGEVVTEYTGYVSNHPLIKISIPAIKKIFA
jgi:lipid II:glycine glycyltransferase (peptidoglycan interpeptide bridge formation enzyme)